MDVGDQKTSISCVEDGISNPETRIHLDYGGSDITQVFHYLLEQIEFPYTDCQPMCRSYDAQLIEKLKTENCHLDLDICGTAEKHFIVSSPGMYVNVLGFFIYLFIFLVCKAKNFIDIFGHSFVFKKSKNPSDILSTSAMNVFLHPWLFLIRSCWN